MNTVPLSIHHRQRTAEHIRLTLIVTLWLFIAGLTLQLPVTGIYAQAWSANWLNLAIHLGLLCFIAFFQRFIQLRQFKLVLFFLYYSYLSWSIQLWPQVTNIHYFFLLAILLSGFVFTRNEKREQIGVVGLAALLFMNASTRYVSTQQLYAIVTISNDFTLAVLCLGIYRVLRCHALERWRTLNDCHQTSLATLHQFLPSHPDNTNTFWAVGMTKTYTCACVLFADLHGYTQLSRQLGDNKTVGTLKALFSELDTLCQQLDIEKIKTNGDQYIVVSGLAAKNASTTGDRMIAFAMQCKTIIAKHMQHSHVACTVKIGIATGPVTAGIIGQSKPYFDVWGKTVNIAAYLEQNCAPDDIQLCPNTHVNLGCRNNLMRKNLHSHKHPDLTHCFILPRA